eukprot:5045883-Alexandrium_andersonii.AAC.1
MDACGPPRCRRRGGGIERRASWQPLHPAFVGRADVAAALAGGLGSGLGRRVAARAAWLVTHEVDAATWVAKKSFGR